MRRITTRVTNDRGAASVELSVIAIVVLLLVFSALQVGLWFHARDVARSAARQGVEQGRQTGSSPAEAVAQAEDFLAKFGGSVKAPSVSSDGSTAEQIRITVRGNVATLIPGLTLSVSQHVDAPVERWTNP
ncbi:TadE family protein [Streptomyces sp. SGAir0957]